MNPYIVVAVMIVIDLITIPFAIKSILKKNIKKKGVVIAAFLTVFIVIEAGFSMFYINSNNFYDREGNTYTSQENVVYYDREGTQYILHETKQDRWHFISKDSKHMYIAERMYLDMDGYMVFDRDDTFVQSDRQYVYIDGEGNEYFRADEMVWNRKGEMKPKKD